MILVRMDLPPLTDEERLRAQRSLEYASGAALLEEDHEVPGAAGIFEQALCNALAVIVAARWAGSEVNGKGTVKSADDLLKVIEAEEARAGRVGPVLVLDEPRATPALPRISIPGWDEVVDTDPGVRIEVKVLREALRITAPRRHGKLSEKSLERRHVEAPVKLDAYPAINVLHGEYGDRRIAKERVRDLWRRDQAEDYLGLLSEEEIERRVEAAQELLPADPKERLICLGLFECSVCENDTLLATHLDDLGLGFAAGTCFVCGYYRSDQVADEEAARFMCVNKWQHE